MEKVVIEVTADDAGIKKLIAEFEKLKQASTGAHNAGKSAAKEETAALGDMHTEAGRLERRMQSLGERIVAVFAVEKIAEFGKEAVEAFAAAELQAKKLEFAITKINGEGAASLNKLIEQSEHLAKSLNNLFTPKQIQGVQTQLANFGLTANMIEKLTPRILDMSRATGKDLSESVEKSILAINGQTKGLRDVGITFVDTGSKTQNFNKLLGDMNKFAGAAAESLDTADGRLQSMANTADIVKESIGGAIFQVGSDFLGFLGDVAKDAGMAVEKLGEFLGIIHQSKTALDVFSEEAKSMTKDELTQSIKLSEDSLDEMVKNGEETSTAYGDVVARLTKKNELMFRKSIENFPKEDLKKLVKDTQGEIDKVSAIHQHLPTQEELDAAATANPYWVTKTTADRKLEILKELLAGMQTMKDDATLKASGAEKKAAKELEEELKKLRELQIKFEDEILKDQIDGIQDANQKKLAEEDLKYKKEQDDLKSHYEFIEKMSHSKDEKVRTQALLDLELYAKDTEASEKAHQDRMWKLAEAASDEAAEKEAKRVEKELKERIKKMHEAESMFEVELKIELEKQLLAKTITQKEFDKKELEAQMEVLEMKKMNLEKGTLEYRQIEEKELALRLQMRKSDAESTKKTIEEIKNFTDAILSALDDSINANIASIDTMLHRQESMIDTQKVLASKGLANDLAFEQKRADQLTAQKLNEQKKLKQAKELETFLNALAQFAEKDPNTALPKALGLLAATKIAETVFAEEGGIIGSGMALAGGRRHKSGKDRLVLAEDGEGILTTNEMSKLGGAAGFNAFRNMLKAPLKEKPIGNSTQKDHGQEIVSRLESLEKTIKDKKELNVSWDTLDSRIEQTIERGVKDRVKNILKKPRL